MIPEDEESAAPVRSRRRSLKLVLSAIFLIVIGAWFYRFVQAQQAEIQSLSLKYPELLLPTAFLIVLSIFTWSIELRVLLSRQQLQMGGFESFCLLMVSGLYNYMTPFRGGLAVRTIYLRNRYRWSLFEQVTFFSSRYFINIVVGSAAGIVIVGLLIWQDSCQLLWLLFCLALVALLGLAAIVCPLPVERMGEIKFLRSLAPYLQIWLSLRRDTTTLLTLAATNVSRILVQAGVWYGCFQVLGIELSPLGALFLAVMGELSLVISITPGGIGIQEGVAVLSAGTIAVLESHVLAAAVIRRILIAIVLVIFGLPGTFVILKRPRQVTRAASVPPGEVVV